jgi:hypothetical protein
VIKQNQPPGKLPGGWFVIKDPGDDLLSHWWALSSAPEA